jgi:chemotaxis protein methyltransferase CheR
VLDALQMKLSTATFEELSRLIHGFCGLVLGPGKNYLIHHRLEPLVRQQGMQSFEELCAVLRQGSTAVLRDAIVEAITTRETSFFRDRYVFETFRRHVLPEIIERRQASPGSLAKIRLWSAGVSTGQEAYSIAMMLHQHVMDAPPGATRPDFSILASDISSAALDIAQRAEYGFSEVRRGLTSNEIERYFEKHGPRWRVREPIRNLVQFRPINLIHPFQCLGYFDAIFCRNVLIYFDEPTRRVICRQFEAMVPDGGWLVLGTAENLYGISEVFVSVRQGESLIYRKTPVRTLADS